MSGLDGSSIKRIRRCAAGTPGRSIHSLAVCSSLLKNGNGGGASGGSYAVVNNPKSSQALNLRQYASTSSVVEAKLYNGTQLWVDEQGTEWSAVTVKNTGVSGYVMTRYLKLYNLPIRPTRRVVHPAGGSYVNLRTSPDMTYGQIAARVPTGNSVTIMIPGQDWCKVTWNGYTGYMLTYFLQQ